MKALDRDGNELCDARITRVIRMKDADHTALVKFTVPREFAEMARGIRCGPPGERRVTYEQL